MGLFSKMRSLTGTVPQELLENGLPERGVIVSIKQTGVSTGADFDPAHVCMSTETTTATSPCPWARSRRR